MLILNASEVRRALPMREAIEAMKRAYIALSRGQATVPLRARLEVPARQAVALFMPAYVPGGAGDALAVKVVTLFSQNIPKGLPLIHAAVLVMDAESGQMRALLEGGTLTAIRTAAGAGAATDQLARADSRVAAILGAGVQARTQLEAVCAVRPIQTVWVYAPTRAHVEAFIREMSPRVQAELRPADSPAQAVSQADVVCAATTSTTPVFDDADIQPGTHVNGVGSYTPQMSEIPPETAARALVALDSRAACQAEAGELIQAVERGWLRWDEMPEIGEILAGEQPGRTSPEQITFFKSVGVAVQDAVAAQLALTNAEKLELGQRVDW